MKYKFTNEHKQWVKELIELTGSESIKLWLNDVKGSVAQSQLDSLQGLTPEGQKGQVKDFNQWVTKGGVRPGHPH